MKPVKTVECNFTYRGPRPEIGDLPCQRDRPGEVTSYWRPSQHELDVLVTGGFVKLTLMTEPIPPIMLTTADCLEAE